MCVCVCVCTPFELGLYLLLANTQLVSNFTSEACASASDTFQNIRWKQTRSLFHIKIKLANDDVI